MGTVCGKTIPYNECPKFLGVHLDRSAVMRCSSTRSDRLGRLTERLFVSQIVGGGSIGGGKNGFSRLKERNGRTDGRWNMLV